MNSISKAALHVFVCLLLSLGTGARLMAQDGAALGELTTDSLSIPGMEEVASSDGPAMTSGAELTLGGLLKSGGWTMYLLVGFAFLLFFLIILNLINLQGKNFSPPSLSGALSADFERADLDGGAEHCKQRPSCLASAVVAGLAQITTRGYGVIDTERFEHHVSDACARFNRARARGVNYFSILAQAAPMLGLLGTVSGMIKAFSNLGREGVGDPSKLAGNISEALVTTAAGLVVALPAVFCYFIFRERLRSLVGDTEDKAFSLFEHLRHTVVTNAIPSEAAISMGAAPAVAAPAPAAPAPAPTASQRLQTGGASQPTASQKLVTQKKAATPKLNTPPQQ